MGALVWMVAFGVLAAKPLSLDDALSLARARHPSLKAADAQVTAARARERVAFAPLLPRVSTSLGYSRSTANFVARPGSVPTALDSQTNVSFNSFDFFSAGLTGSASWDFGQSWHRWLSSKEGVGSVEAQAKAERVALGLEVRLAYFEAARQQELREVAEAGLANAQVHFSQAQAFVRAGSRPQIDVVQAKADVAQAKLAAITARNAERTALVRLLTAVGLARAEPVSLTTEPPPALDVEGKDVGQALGVAMEARPELAQLASQVRAQELALKAVQGAYGPTVSATLGLTLQSRSLAQAIVPNASLGVSLAWPLYEGGVTLAQEAEARAQLQVLAAQKGLLEQQLALDVEQAWVGLEGARATLEAAEEAAEAAVEEDRFAVGRYQAGAGNAIELGDARVRLTVAQSQAVQAKYALAQARARLSAALGQE